MEKKKTKEAFPIKTALKKAREKKVRNKVKKPTNPTAFEDRDDVQRLYLYIVIVNVGIGDDVISLLQSLGSSMQFTHIGTGTAPDSLKTILGVNDASKEIIHAFIKEKDLDIVTAELNAFFMAAIKNRGVGFAIPMSSLMGVRAYKYLTQTM